MSGTWWKVSEDEHTLYLAGSKYADGYQEYKGGVRPWTLEITSISFKSRCTLPDDCTRMFAGCTRLTSLILNNTYFDTSNVTRMREMFSECTGLTDLNLEGWDTHNVTDMGYMFSSCTNLSLIDVTNWDTSNVTDMSNVFKMCPSLYYIDLSDWDVSNVITFEGMFAGCTNLGALPLDGWSNEVVQNVAGMFDSCPKLVRLNLAGFSVGNLKEMSGIFQGDSELTTIYATDWIDEVPSNCYSACMFSGCVKLPNYPAAYNKLSAHDCNDDLVPKGYFASLNYKLNYGTTELNDNNYRIVMNDQSVGKVYKKRHCHWEG